MSHLIHQLCDTFVMRLCARGDCMQCNLFGLQAVSVWNEFSLQRLSVSVISAECLPSSLK